MNCASSSATGRTCVFAADRLAILERTVATYAKMRSAALDAARAGKLDAHWVAEDTIVLDRKVKEASALITLLKPCVRA